MSRITEKIIGGLFALFLIITVGYQVYLGIYGSIKTETVFDYTVSRTIPVKGIAIRSEVVMEDKYDGIENCIYEDGTRVSIGEDIAEFYENEQSDVNLRRLRELEAEIKMLEEAQDSSVNNFSTTDILNRDIKEQLGRLAKISGRGRFDTAGEVKMELTSLVNKKQIATGQEQNFKNRISELKAEYSGLQKLYIANSTTVAAAPASGYFSRVVDGYEEKLTPDIIKKYSVADYLSLIDAPPIDAPEDKIGKIVTDQNWIFAAACTKSSLEFVRPGQEVFITFDSINKSIPAIITDVLQERDDENIVLLLSCNQISGGLLSLRNTPAVINFSQYTGLRLNMSDIRFQGEARGVYILDNNTVRFKLIDPIYEEQSFVLSRLIPPDTNDREYVNLFDQLITKGNDLSDGKVIQ